jgi:tetratricopeptide (TPR) repeat protein
MKKPFSSVLVAILLLSGCTLNNSSNDVIKITSDSKNIKNVSVKNKVSLLTAKQYLDKGETDKALKFLGEYGDFFEKEPEYLRYLGRAYAQKGLYAEALTSLDRFAEVNKNNYSVLFDYAEVYKKQKNNKKASEYLINYIFKTNDSSKFATVRTELNKIAEPAQSSGLLGKISLSDKAIISKNKIEGLKQAFAPETEEIFAEIEMVNASNVNKIKAKWNFITAKGEEIPVNSTEFSVEGTKPVLVSIKSPVTGWIAGKYEFSVLVNGVKTASLKFYVF